jgi:hypothetical protein
MVELMRSVLSNKTIAYAHKILERNEELEEDVESIKHKASKKVSKNLRKHLNQTPV